MCMYTGAPASGSNGSDADYPPTAEGNGPGGPEGQQSLPSLISNTTKSMHKQ